MCTQPWVEWFSREVLSAPVRAFPEHKRSFLPAQGDRAAVARLAHALRMGWLKSRKQLALERAKSKVHITYRAFAFYAGEALRVQPPIPPPENGGVGCGTPRTSIGTGIATKKSSSASASSSWSPWRPAEPSHQVPGPKS